jgi:hypothetical protein
LPLEVEFVWHNSRRLFPDNPVVTQSDDAQSGASDEPLHFLPGGFLISGGTAKWGLRLASAKRALFQLLDELPGRETFHQVDMLMQGLANLSPRSLQVQLASCTSILKIRSATAASTGLIVRLPRMCSPRPSRFLTTS